MKPLIEKLLLGAVIILILLQVIELPASFNKIGIPYGAKQLNSQGNDVYKLSNNLLDERVLWASLSGTYPSTGAGLLYGHTGSGKNGIYLEAISDTSGQGYVMVTEGLGLYLYDTTGGYHFLPDTATWNNITIYNGYYEEPCMRLVRQGANDYRLQVMQNSSWVTK